MREIDLQDVFLILLHRIWVIVLVTITAAAAALAITHYYIVPQYTASIKLYVNNSIEANNDLTSSDLSASQSLVDTYITIIQSDTVLDAVIEKTGINYTTKGLISHISAGALNGTEVFQVSVTTSNPEQSALIANAIADEVPAILANIVTGSSVKIVDSAKVPVEPSSPSYTKNTAIGLLAGFVLSCAIILVIAFLDTRIKTKADLSHISTLPVLGVITEFHVAAKIGYGYTYKEHVEGK